MFRYNVYAMYTKSTGIVTDIFSGVFKDPLHNDTVDTIVVKSGSGDEFVHVQSDYPIFDSKGCYNYKVVDKTLVERTEFEKQNDMILNSVITNNMLLYGKAKDG